MEGALRPSDEAEQLHPRICDAADGDKQSQGPGGNTVLRNILGWNFTDSASVGAGWDVANGANYDTTVSALVNYIWMHEEENDKSRKVWPNPNAPTTIKARPRT